MTCKQLNAVQVPCPCCGEEIANISVNLYALDGDAFTCHECGADFTIDTVRTLIARWTKLLAWLDTVPQFDTDE